MAWAYLQTPGLINVFAGNIVFVPPVKDAAPEWQPLLLELHHLDDMNRLRVINLIEGPRHSGSKFRQLSLLVPVL